jgi:hypothetical protein
MATYYLNSGAAGTGSGADWTNAFTTYAAAIAAASASGDVIKVHKTHTEELAVDTIYTHLNNIAVICVDKDASDALATMGTAAWIGNSTANRSVTIAGAFKLYFYGITFRCAGSSADSLILADTDKQQCEYESCYFWNGITATSYIYLLTADNAYVHCKNCTFRVGATGSSIRIEGGRARLTGGSISSAGSTPTLLFHVVGTVNQEAATLDVVAFDASLVTGTLIGSATDTPIRVMLSQCKFGAAVTVMATQTTTSLASAEVYVFDCASGDTHGFFGYYNALGSVVSDTGIYFTSGAAAQSWKIVTTGNCSYYTPFETPWFGYYNTGTSAITPYIEILRDGSTTAYQDDEVWIDVLAKVTASSTQSSLSTDRMAVLGTAANQAAGAGLGSWTGESGTAWSGKIGLGASITPAEVGHIQARIVVGEPSVTVYADPQLRT